MRILYVSASMLAKIAACHTQAALATLGYGSAEPSTPPVVGTLFHAALARDRDGQEAHEVMRAFKSEYYEAESQGLILDPDEGYELDNLALILEEWQERNQPSTWPFKVNATNVPFDLELGVLTASADREPIQVRLIGYLDADVTDLTGDSVWVVEDKTTRKPLNAAYFSEFRTSPQTGAYIYALAEIRKKRVSGCYINAISMRKLPDSDRRCRDHGVAYAECGRLHLDAKLYPLHRPSDDLAEWRTQALEFAQEYLDVLRVMESGGGGVGQIEHVRQQGRFRGACTRCDFYAFCASGRDPGVDLPPLREYKGDRMRSGLFAAPQQERNT